MSDPIEIALELEGTSQAAAGVGDVTEQLEQLDAAARQASEATDQISQGMRDTTAAATRATAELGQTSAAQRALGDSAQGMAIRVNEVQGRTEAFGSALTTLGSNMSGISPELDALGQSFGAVGDTIDIVTSLPGPLGRALGGLNLVFGLTSTAIEYFKTQTEDTGAQMRSFEVDVEAVTEALDEQVEAYRRADEARRIAEGNATAAEANAVLERESARLADLETQRDALQEVIDQENQRRVAVIEGASSTIAARDAVREYEAELAAARDRVGQLTSAIETQREAVRVAADEAGSLLMDNLSFSAGQETGSGGGGGERQRAQREAERQVEQERLDAQRRFAQEFDERLAAERELFDLRMWQIDQDNQARERAHQAELRRQSEIDRANRRSQEVTERGREVEKRWAEEMEAMSEKRIADYQELTGTIADGLTTALVSTIAGTESADEAFQGMLASFLGALSQMAGLEAAKNYARAIEFFSTQRYDQGALAIAAGTAWLAVAVAAGAGSVAVSPPAASAPASPESGGGGGGDGGGGTTIVHYNAPVVTTATRAELGREMSTLIDEGRRRLGSGR